MGERPGIGGSDHDSERSLRGRRIILELSRGWNFNDRWLRSRWGLLVVHGNGPFIGRRPVISRRAQKFERDRWRRDRIRGSGRRGSRRRQPILRARRRCIRRDVKCGSGSCKGPVFIDLCSCRPSRHDHVVGLRDCRRAWRGQWRRQGCRAGGHQAHTRGVSAIKLRDEAARRRSTARRRVGMGCAIEPSLLILVDSRRARHHDSERPATRVTPRDGCAKGYGKMGQAGGEFQWVSKVAAQMLATGVQRIMQEMSGRTWIPNALRQVKAWALGLQASSTRAAVTTHAMLATYHTELAKTQVATTSVGQRMVPTSELD